MISGLVGLLERHRFRFGPERELQAGIEKMLAGAGVPFERERDLGAAGRVDFLVQGIAVEVKVAGSADAARAQLTRYAGSELVAGVLLVTSCWQVSRQPEELAGKPVRVFTILRAFA